MTNVDALLQWVADFLKNLLDYFTRVMEAMGMGKKDEDATA